jgi:hypothetical protein
MTEKEARDQLRDILPPGSTAYTILRHVSRSGMFRVIDIVAVDGKDGVQSLSWLAAKAGVGKLDRDRQGLRVSGCGMDMGFHVVYNLAGTLYGHVDREPDDLSTRDKRRLRAWRKRELARYPGANASGGYAISHRWL